MPSTETVPTEMHSNSALAICETVLTEMHSTTALTIHNSILTEDLPLQLESLTRRCHVRPKGSEDLANLVVCSCSCCSSSCCSRSCPL